MYDIYRGKSRGKNHDIEVCVEPSFVPEGSHIGDAYYLFSYTITIINQGKRSCQLLKREWTIRNGHKETEHIRGKGVLGEYPIIGSKQLYRYKSFCPLETPTGNMRGRFQFIDQKGHHFWLNIPVFFFKIPTDAHPSLAEHIA